MPFDSTNSYDSASAYDASSGGMLVFPDCPCCMPQSGSGSGCAIPGWGGPGWYCILYIGECTRVELVEGDECNDLITICSGPYATEAEAQAACIEDNEAVQTTCCSNKIKRQLTGVFGSVFCPFNGFVFTLVYQDSGADAGKWVGNRTTGGNTITFKLFCNAGTWTLEAFCNGVAGSGGSLFVPSFTCDPFHAQFNGVTVFPCCPLGGALTIDD
jgi:hypothetical protein